MPAHVVCPTLSTMCSELLSGRPRPESGFDDDRYVRLLAVDPVLGSIARVQGRPDPFAWFVAGGAGATNFAAMVLHIGSQQISTRATWSPAAVRRTARVTSAPAEARARAVSTPIPDEPPVTIAR
jgi:hypothetical protein